MGMKWNDHRRLKDEHALLGGSNSAWLRYDADKLRRVKRNLDAKTRGTKLHEYAQKSIELGCFQIDNGSTLSEYVKDAIAFGMDTEITLYYSEYAFGKADAICFRDGVLRIHDLKTGAVPAHVEQLQIYAALFCLEYEVDPETIDIELRIYQSNAIRVDKPHPNDIRIIMDIIREHTETLREMDRRA